MTKQEIKILIGGRTAELKPLENQTMDDRCANNLKSSGSVKKEVITKFS